MDDIPKWWQHTSIFVVPVPISVIVVARIMYLFHTQVAHHLFFMIYAEFNICASIGFSLIYNHFIWAHSRTRIDMVKRQMSSIDALHMYILNSLRRTWWCAHGSVRVSFFPELHRLNVASFHPRHFFSLSSPACTLRGKFTARGRHVLPKYVAKIYSENVEKWQTAEWKEKKKLGKIDDINWFYILDEYVWGGHSTPTASMSSRTKYHQRSAILYWIVCVEWSGVWSTLVVAHMVVVRFWQNSACQCECSAKKTGNNIFTRTQCECLLVVVYPLVVLRWNVFYLCQMAEHEIHF